MNNQERLEEIKDAYQKSHKHIGAYVSSKGIEWLIEQAERVQELERTITNKIMPEIERGYEQNQRYKQALEYIASIEFYEGTQGLYDDMSEASETAEDALRGDTE